MEIARRQREFEIVSMDAMCVYREMDIGTAKPSLTDQAAVPHHLLDVVDPSEDYTLTRFQDDLAAAVADIATRGKRALLVGGTGLYVRAAVDGLTVPPRFPDVRAELEGEPDTAALHARLAALDPVAAARMLPSNRRRVVRALEVCEGSGRSFSSFGPGLESYGPTPYRQVGLWVSRDTLAQRLDNRLDAMLAAGFVDEVRTLAGPTRGVSRTARQALGYRQLFDHVENGVPLDESIALARQATKQFARRQRVWFRRDPRIAWVNADFGESVVVGGQHW